MAEKTWVLFGWDDPSEAPILESFDSSEGPPTAQYIKNMFGDGVLYEFDLVDNQAINPCRIAPRRRQRRLRRRRKEPAA
jgi:hypothetical protein